MKEGEMTEPHVKGVAIRGILSSMERLCPPGAIDQLVPLLSESFGRSVKHRSFVSGGWYPLREYRNLLGAVMQVTGHDVEIIETLAREATLNDFRSGIYQLLKLVLSPEFLMRRAGGVFSRYYDTGSLRVVEARHGYAEAQFRGCIGFDRVLWRDAVAGAMAVLEASGAKDVRIRPLRGGGDGDVDLDIISEWR
jgi:hypothetical protein